MYHALLTNRYLTTRVIPFIAVAAVALCTSLVIIVVSVMSGFVDMVRDAGKTLMGDVIIAYPIHGLPHYERLMGELKELPEVAAVSPVVDSWGLLKMPYDETEVVQVWAIEPESFNAVTGYFDALYWKPVTDEQWVALLKNAADERWEQLLTIEEFDPQPLLEAADGDEAMAALLESTALEHREAVLELPESQWREKLPGLVGDWWFTFEVREPLLRDDPADPLRMQEVAEAGQRLSVPVGDGERAFAMVTGIHVSKANERRSDGTYKVVFGGQLWMPRHEVTLTMLPISRDNRVSDARNRIFPVANEAQFGVYQIDDKRVLIPLHIGQEMLELGEQDIVEFDEQTDEPVVVGKASKRATLLLISAAEGVTPQQLKVEVQAVYDRLDAALEQEQDAELLPQRMLPGATEDRLIKTWEEQNAAIIGPVEKERNLMRILFSIIYFVCAVLVLVIFWAIVYEKTRDIGILRSIGASRLGILWIFVRYGLVVGVVGSIVGLGLAWIVVRNINHIHNALGDPFPLWASGGVAALAVAALIATFWMIGRGDMLPIVVMALVTAALIGAALGMFLHRGFLVWDPKVYYFTQIPNHLDAVNAIVTMIGAVAFSVIGALIPAARAGDIDPVSALRYE